jgi:hypothetical protein
MQERGTVVSLICPLVSPAGGPIGLVAAEYLNRGDVPRNADAAFQRIRESAHRVYRLLASVNDR